MRSWTAIAAMADNRAIGLAGRIPWHCPGDLKSFKALTYGRTVLVGRKTYEFLPSLPGRRVLVLSRTKVQGVETVSTLDEAPDDLVVIGGASVYLQAMGDCRLLCLTRVHQSPAADAFMPPFEHLFQPPVKVRSDPDFDVWEYRK